MFKLHQSTKALTDIFSLALVLIFVYWAINNFEAITWWIGWMFGVLAPFIAGGVIAYFLSIPVFGLERLLAKINHPLVQKKKRGLSVLMVYLAGFGIIYGLLSVVLPPLFSAVVDLVSSVPGFIETTMQFLSELDQDEVIVPLLNMNLEELTNLVTELLPHDLFMLENVIAMLTTNLGALLGGAGFIFDTFLAIITSVYFMFETDKLIVFTKRVLYRFLPQSKAQRVIDYGKKTDGYFRKYIFCVLIDCTAMAIVAPVILHFVIGSPFATLLGVTLGVFNAIPFFGSIIAVIIAVVVILFTQGLTRALLALGVLLVLQQVDGNWFQPWLYGGSLKLNRLLVIICIVVGGAVGNLITGGMGGMIAGMFVAIPVTKILSVVGEDILNYNPSQIIDMMEQAEQLTLSEAMDGL